MQRGQRFGRDCGGYWIVAGLDYIPLPLPTEYVFDELSAQRVQRFAGLMVDIEIEKPGQWILARVGVLGRRLDKLALIVLGQWNDSHVGGFIADATVADSETIGGTALDN